MALTRSDMRGRRRGVSDGAILLVVLLLGSAAAAATAAGLTATSGQPSAAELGLPDPGALTRLGLPIVRAVTEIAITVTIGGLLLATVLVRPRQTGYLDVAGYQGLRLARTGASVWAGAAAVLVPLLAADVTGRPVHQVLVPSLVTLIPQVPVTAAWTANAVAAVTVLLGSSTVLTRRWSFALLAVAVLGLAPLAASGHSAGGAHDLAIDSLLLHVTAATVWVGGLVAVLVLAVRPTTRGFLAEALPRFSGIAFWSSAIVASSGVINLLLRVPASALLTSTYGRVALAKTVALVVLGGLGYLQRVRALPAAARGDLRILMRLSLLEILLMLSTLGLAVSLGRIAPPPGAPDEPSRTAELLGYDLSGPPTAVRLLIDWRPDFVVILLAGALVVTYLNAVNILKRRHEHWPARRILAWTTGCLVIVVATSSGVSRYAASMFSMHLVAQVLLAAVAPILLVVGAPLDLRRRVHARGPRRGASHDTATAATPTLRQPPPDVLDRPAVAIGLLVGWPALLYIVGVADLLLADQLGRLAVDLLTVVTGTLGAQAVVGTTSRLWSHRIRLVALVLVGQGAIAAWLMTIGRAIAEQHYRTLRLEWVPDLLADQRSGAILWLAAQVGIAAAVLAVALLWQRCRSRYSGA